MNDQIQTKGAGGIHIADEKGIILFTDPAFDSLFGYDRGTLVGKHVSILNTYSKEENSQKIRGILRFLETVGVWEGNFFNQKRNGVPISTQSRILPIKFSGQKGWLAVVEDIGKIEPPGEALKFWMSFTRLTMNISTKFARLEPHESEKGILDALKMIGEFIEADHGYICLVSEESKETERVCEWCAPGVEPELSQLKGSSANCLPWRRNLLPVPKKDQHASVESQHGEPDPVLLIPIYYGKSSAGFLGFDGLKSGKIWPEETTALLRMAGEILIGAWERKRAEEGLRKIEEKYRNLVENMNDVIFSLDQQGCFTFISPVVEQLTSYKTEEMVGQPLARFIHSEDLPDFQENLKRNLSHNIESFEFRILDKKGNVRYMRASSRPLINNGQPAGLTGILSDITAHKWAEGWLRKTQEKYRSLFENALEGIFQSTLEGQFIIANPACAQILGYSSPQELIAQHSKPTGLSFADPTKYQEFKRMLTENGVVQKYEAQVFRRDQNMIWVSLNALAIRTHSGVPLFYEGRMEDITERKQSEDRIYHLSFHDKLTGLYNRAYFEEELKRLDTDRQLPISVILGDVNCLKLINDAFGHPEGDKLLTQIALILRESCRKEDVIARLGGDEFAIFLPKTSASVTGGIVQRINLFCSQKSIGPVQVSIALGTGTKEMASQDIQGILRDAEEGMYKNKLLESKNIRNSFIFSLRKSLFEKSFETEGHTRRLEQLSLQVGGILELSDEELHRLTLLTAWHDIGNIALPEEILRKPGRLTEEEWKWIRKHPEIGYRIAESSPELISIAEAILAHHERWDGSGYPLGLKGEDIPIISRIVSIVDAYDAMTQGRPYKSALSSTAALNEIMNGAGSQFDPKLVEISLKIIPNQDQLNSRNNP